jgi:hypothetical protein
MNALSSLHITSRTALFIHRIYQIPRTFWGYYVPCIVNDTARHCVQWLQPPLQDTGRVKLKMTSRFRPVPWSGISRALCLVSHTTWCGEIAQKKLYLFSFKTWGGKIHFCNPRGTQPQTFNVCQKMSVKVQHIFGLNVKWKISNQYYNFKDIKSRLDLKNTYNHSVTDFPFSCLPNKRQDSRVSNCRFSSFFPYGLKLISRPNRNIQVELLVVWEHSTGQNMRALEEENVSGVKKIK